MLRLLLFPLSIIYDLVTRVRNHLYNIGHKPSFRFEVPVISVGNLNVGGSGKTPMTEYLIRLLSGTVKVSTLSRGYGRRTRGFRIANSTDDATTIGDEPFQMYRKFSDSIIVAVGEERALAIPNILHEHEDVGAIILDDAYQHRAVQPHFSILLTEYSKPFTHDYVLPAGDLRESRKGAARADVIVVTKCPAQIDEDALRSDIQRYAGKKPVFFSRLAYSDPVPFGNHQSIAGRLLIVTGIANPEPFISYLKSRFEILKHFTFADHHQYSESEIRSIHYEVAQYSDVAIITTEKDMVRLRNLPGVDSNSWFYMPISMEFIKNGSEFDELVVRQLSAIEPQ